MTSPQTPSDEELHAAIVLLRQLNPYLGRAKFLSLIKDKYSWVLSETRLKKMSKSSFSRIICRATNFLMCSGMPKSMLQTSFIPFRFVALVYNRTLTTSTPSPRTRLRIFHEDPSLVESSSRPSRTIKYENGISSLTSHPHNKKSLHLPNTQHPRHTQLVTSAITLNFCSR